VVRLAPQDWPAAGRPPAASRRRTDHRNSCRRAKITAGKSSMSGNRRLELSEVGDVTVVRFVDRKILDVTNIHELGKELFALVEEQNRKKLLLNFGTVEFLSSETLGELIKLEKKVKQHQGRLMLTNIKPEIYEVFAITRLNKLFDIRDEEAEALAAFSA
jgi:anti-sigma B factor antagonist